MTDMVEITLIITFILWQINQSQKITQINEQQNLDIRDVKHSVHDVCHSLAHHIETTEIRLESVSNVVDKIWNKIE
jgi:hypothetical protein